MPTGETTNQLLQVLHWYAAMGVDAALDEDAIDWFARGAMRPGADFAMPQQQSPPPTAVARQARPDTQPDTQPDTRHVLAGAGTPTSARTPPEAPPSRAPTTRTVPAPTPRSFVAQQPDAAVTAARALAPQAASLDALGQMLAGFDGCGLKATAKSLCFYRGASQARLMVIGEAPGREEDLEGKPFVGPAGLLLDRMLAAIGLTDADCHITNAVYWRPPGNRTPTPQEMDVCRPFLERQVALVAPAIVLLLGAAAARDILATDESIMRVRGKWRDVTLGGHTARTMATLHPTYLLRTPAAKQQAWKDLLAVKAALAS